MALSSIFNSDKLSQLLSAENLKQILSSENLKLAAKAFVPGYVVYIVGCAVYNRYFHRLSHFPGPFWASVTPLWYFRTIRNGKAENVGPDLHKKYGRFVRIAPNLIAISDPAAIDVIYGPKDGKYWRKGDFYDGFDPHIPGSRTDSFSERDNNRHANRRRLIANLYTQGSILNYEPCVDRIIDLLYTRMETLSESGEVFDMSVWLKRYTFDVIGEIYYGRDGGFGMIREDRDYNNWCYLMLVMPNIGAAITYMPWGFQGLYMGSQMVYRSSRDALKGMFDVVKQAQNSANERWKLMQEGGDYPKGDMLTGLLEIVREKGDQVGWSVADVATEIWAVIWAGSDTTGNALCSIFYHLHKNPEKLAVLLREIDSAFEEGRLSYPLRFSDARKLPYLHAVILESMRVHPSLGLGLPREVPSGGADVCGTFLPGDAEVIMNSNSLGRDIDTFGDDCDEWIPERWLRVNEEEAGKMERACFTFGHGPRVCIGRHITNIEMYKMLPTILRGFEFKLHADEWKVNNGWFKIPTDIMVSVSKRHPDAPRPKLVL